MLIYYTDIFTKQEAEKNTTVAGKKIAVKKREKKMKRILFFFFGIWMPIKWFIICMCVSDGIDKLIVWICMWKNSAFEWETMILNSE